MFGQVFPFSNAFDLLGKPSRHVKQRGEGPR